VSKRGLNSRVATVIVAVLSCASAAQDRVCGHKTPQLTVTAIDGAVVEPNGAPVAYATVRIESHPASKAVASIMTDASGHFSISHIPAGKYVATFQHDRFRPEFLALLVKPANTPRRIRLVMRRLTGELDCTVTAATLERGARP
jgi:protocatechuate 3,4-dioxygenase beta subunit